MEAKKKTVKKRILGVIILAVLILLAAICYYLVTNSGKKDGLDFGQIQQTLPEPAAALSNGTTDTSKTLEGHTLVAENDLYELYLYEPALSIIVRNKSTGAVMESTIRDNEKLANVNETWKGFLQSGVVVELQEETNT
ncbi:MAG: hypothetical protein MR531_17160, partial [Lachnospiraceae bacterium]|nr:hypothetical protein [Lachnospiraceae bacterium]